MKCNMDKANTELVYNTMMYFICDDDKAKNISDGENIY